MSRIALIYGFVFDDTLLFHDSCVCSFSLLSFQPSCHTHLHRKGSSRSSPARIFSFPGRSPRARKPAETLLAGHDLLAYFAHPLSSGFSSEVQRCFCPGLMQPFSHATTDATLRGLPYSVFVVDHSSCQLEEWSFASSMISVFSSKNI